MIRAKLLVAICVVWSLMVAAAVGEVLHVEGVVLSASLPWSDRLFDERDGPLLAYPTHVGALPYTGVLTVDAERALASLEISVYSCVAGGEYCLMATDLETGSVEEVPTTYRLLANLFDGIVRNDAGALVIDYTSPVRPEEWVTSFELALDKTTGEGEWHWSHGPPVFCVGNVCAPSVPGNEASGTITGFLVVPEPGSLALALWCVVAVVARRNRRTEY